MAGGFGGARGSKRRLNAEINVVPYIDVMLVLLIIFMVTAPLLIQGVEVELPKTSSEPVALEEDPLTLSVSRRGEYFLNIGRNQEAPISDGEVVERVGAVMRNKPGTTVLIKADGRVDYARVANGMALLQRAGAAKLGFIMDPPDARKR